MAKLNLKDIASAGKRQPDLADQVDDILSDLNINLPTNIKTGMIHHDVVSEEIIKARVKIMKLLKNKK